MVTNCDQNLDSGDATIWSKKCSSRFDIPCIWPLGQRFCNSWAPKLMSCRSFCLSMTRAHLEIGIKNLACSVSFNNFKHMLCNYNEHMNILCKDRYPYLLLRCGRMVCKLIPLIGSKSICWLSWSSQFKLQLPLKQHRHVICRGCVGEVGRVFLGDVWEVVWDMFGRFLGGMLRGC